MVAYSAARSAADRPRSAGHRERLPPVSFISNYGVSLRGVRADNKEHIVKFYSAIELVIAPLPKEVARPATVGRVRCGRSDRHYWCRRPPA